MGKFIVVLFIVSIIFSCTGKREHWSDQQKEEFITECEKLYVEPVEGRSDKNLMRDLCDCKYQVTSRNYTPLEAKSLTRDQIMKLMEECNYNW